MDRVRSRWGAVALLLAGATLIATLFGQRGSVGSLLPHGYCFTWNPALLWTHVLSDTLIGAAYVSIPATLLRLVKKRSDLPFNWIVVLFAVFILSCGATHWIEVWTVWNPDYWLSANVKLLTAIASLLTAATLVRLLPKILAVPTVAELTATRDALEVEVRHRRLAEEELLRERAELERRVLERTEELSRATAAAAAAHAQAEEANRLKDRFLAKVSHELRTPLQSTMTWAQLLQRTPGDVKRATQAADRIMHNVRTQARLIDDLLDISRILSGKLSLQLERIDVVPVIEKAVDVVRSASAARGITIDVSARVTQAVMDCDPVRLEQVVWNLLNNAVQASPDAGRVELRFATVDGALIVQVQDRGRGIAAADLPLIFEPFRQGLNSDNSHRGLGLGLAITRSIALLFGGELRAESEGLGHGSTFTMQLPIALAGKPGEQTGQVTLTEEERRHLRGLRILYVEDEPDIAEGGRQMLVALGAEVSLCTNFDEASARIGSGGFDVFLSDLNLGDGQSALDLMPILRRSPQGQAVPAIVLSAYGSVEDQQATSGAGFVRHLVKPTEAESVARALVEVTGHGER